MLLEAGASVELISKKEYPVQTAYRWKHFEIVELFLMKKCYSKEKLKKMFRTVDVVRMRELLVKCGVDLKEKGVGCGLCCGSKSYKID